MEWRASTADSGAQLGVLGLSSREGRGRGPSFTWHCFLPAYAQGMGAHSLYLNSQSIPDRHPRGPARKS